MRACEVVQLQTPSYYDNAILGSAELALRHSLRELAVVRVRFGYRRLAIMLRREGRLMNGQCVFRLYREEGGATLARK